MSISNITRSGRGYVVALAVVTALALALAGTVAASQTATPGPPSNIVVTPSDTEATISWDAPPDGDCPPTDYQVWVRDISTEDGERITGDEVPSPWTATGLTASTPYRVQVWTYSLACDEYSSSAAEVEFTTTAANTDDAAEPAEKHAPKRVRNLRAARTGIDTARVSWNAPGTKNGKHHAATEYMFVRLEFDSNGEKTEIYRSSGTDNWEGVLELTAGTKYRFRVAPYSSECDCWGRWRGVTYVHS